MRSLPTTLAVAGAIAAGCVTTRAQVVADERYSVAMMSASDVIRTLRCAPPLGCKRQPSKPRGAVTHDPGKRAAISERLRQLGIAF